MNAEKRIWQFLRLNGLTEAGAAGLMGNLYAESGLMSGRVEMLCLTRLSENGQKYNDATYVKAVDSGRITRERFLHPLPGKQYGFGLAQWTSPGRKAGLYDLARQMATSIGDLEMQLAYLMRELQSSYKSVYATLCAAQSVQAASDAVLMRFECPADCGTSVRAARAGYAKNYYEKYKGTKTGTEEKTETEEKTDNKTETENRTEESRMNGTRQNVIDLANSQGRNRGGITYWSWWGYGSRVPWCQIFVSWIMEKAGVPLSVYGKYENCQYAIGKMKEKGVWHPNGYRPKAGDVIYYDWGYDGTSDHVGIVVKVSGDAVTVREGNKNDAVENRIIAYNHRQIIGYASPTYAEETTDSTGTEGACKVKVNRIVKGSKGNQVKTVQRLLNALGHKGADGKKLTVDGECGENTMHAVAAFQKAADVKVTTGYGKAVLDKTWKALLNAK